MKFFICKVFQTNIVIIYSGRGPFIIILVATVSEKKEISATFMRIKTG